jgi:hypothetical protein
MSFEREGGRETVMGTSGSHGHEVGMKIQDDVVFQRVSSRVTLL